MALPELAPFALAGGTSLALQIGHRISVDLDFFGSMPLEIEEILDLLHPLGNVTILKQSRNILITDINGVKVDFVNYRYPLLNPPIVIDNLRLVRIEDIAAMKLAAIAGRGRKRDFIDLFFLLKSFSLPEMMGFYTQKYQDGSEMMIARSLTYFNDADSDEDMQMLQPISWDTVKTFITDTVKQHYR